MDDFHEFRIDLYQTIDKHVNNIAKLWKGMGLPHGVLEERIKHVKDEVMATMLRLECEVLREKEKLDEELVSAASKVVALSGELEVDEMDPQEDLRTYELVQFFKDRCQILETEKEARELKEIISMQSKVKKLLADLEKEASTPVEKFIVSSSNIQRSVFPLESVKRCVEELEVCANQNHKAVSDLRNRLTTLLKTLNLPVEQHADLLAEDNSYKLSTIRHLTDRLAHYEAIKTAKMKSLIHDVRTEIQNLWERCDINEDNRRACLSFYSTREDEETLSDLKKYLDSCRLFSDKLTGIMDKVSSQEKSWTDLMNVEHRLSDPNRFLNRGGQLLKDENLRKRLLNLLPKMEAEVLKEIEELKADHGYDFLHHSIPYHIVCQDRWKEFNDKKASETALRIQYLFINQHKQKSNTLKEELRYGSKPANTGKPQCGGFVKKSSDDQKATTRSHQNGSRPVSGGGGGCFVMPRESSREEICSLLTKKVESCDSTRSSTADSTDATSSTDSSVFDSVH